MGGAQGDAELEMRLDCFAVERLCAHTALPQHCVDLLLVIIGDVRVIEAPRRLGHVNPLHGVAFMMADGAICQARRKCDGGARGGGHSGSICPSAVRAARDHAGRRCCGSAHAPQQLERRAGAPIMVNIGWTQRAAAKSYSTVNAASAGRSHYTLTLHYCSRQGRAGTRKRAREPLCHPSSRANARFYADPSRTGVGVPPGAQVSA